MLKEAYQNGTAQVETEKLSRKISIMKGVRQDDTLSRNMFIAAVEEICKRIEWDSGMNINGVRLNNLMFAVIILFVEREGELKKLVVELSVEGKKME